MLRSLHFAGRRTLLRRRSALVLATALAIASMTGLAVASKSSFNPSPLGVAKVQVAGHQKTIVVDSRGVTVYELGGESLRHLLCAPRACLRVWLAVKVPSGTTRVSKAAGVPGKLTILHRVKGGFYQLMLDNHPIYYYSLDKGAKGAAKGQGLKSYGGTWHVVPAS